MLELPEPLQAHDFTQSIVRIEHVANPAIYYGSRVPVVTLDPKAEALGIFLECKPLFGNLHIFKILFEGVVCWSQSDALRHSDVPNWGVRPDKLIKCGAGRVYVSQKHICPLPTLR